MIRNCILLLFVLVSTICFSQTDRATMFFNDGESVEGYASIKNNKIKFRVSLEDKALKWDFNSVYKLNFNTFFGVVAYEYVPLKNSLVPILMRLVTEGEVSLYRNESIGWQQNFVLINEISAPSRQSVSVNYYVHRVDEEYPTCLDCKIFKSWKKQLAKYLDDCPSLVDQLKNNELLDYDLQDIVEYYNDLCVD